MQLGRKISVNFKAIERVNGKSQSLMLGRIVE